MTLTQMQYYKAVCQHMSLTKASRELHISQPALSMAIKEIEHECGVALFHRTANSLSITDQGVVLLDEVNTILSQHEHLQHLLSNNLLSRNYVRIGLSPLKGNAVFPDIVRKFREMHPDIQLFITESGTGQHYENLDNNKVDLIITGKHPDLSFEEWENSSVYEHIALKPSDIVFAVSKDHPLAVRGSVTWADIAKEPLILLNPPFEQMHFVSSHLEAAGVPMPQNVYRTNQIYTVLRFIERNVAAGFISKEIAMENPHITALSIPVNKEPWIYLVFRKDHYLFLSAKLFIQTAKEVFKIKKKV